MAGNFYNNTKVNGNYWTEDDIEAIEAGFDKLEDHTPANLMADIIAGTTAVEYVSTTDSQTLTNKTLTGMVLGDDYPTILPSLNLDFANARTLDPRITFTRNTGATYYDHKGRLSYAAAGEARFNHDPATLASKGLLIEEARTNLLTHSEDFGLSLIHI